MSERTITLSADQVAALRSKGQAFADPGEIGDMVRLIRDGSGYGPLPGASNEIVLSDADVDLIEQQPEGLVVADVTRTTGWTIRVEAAR